MPCGAYEKDEIRKIAEEIELRVAKKPDSQEICFVPDDDYAGFIEQSTGKKIPEGNFVDKDGKVLGKHKGIIHYTVGQRKGLDLPMGRRVFVTELRPETNEVVIGEGNDVFGNVLYANKLNWMGMECPSEKIEVDAKIRYNHKGAKCQVEVVGEDLVRCYFPEPVRAITPGQAVVFYDGDIVLGGGTIIGTRL
jgi:tRNA-specific 2-thiouridylase